MSDLYDTCKDPNCSSAGREHGHIEFSREDIEHMQAIRNASQMQSSVDEIERTRPVNVHDHQDLLDHLKSDNGHLMGRHAEWRNTHQDDHIPGVRPRDWEDRQMSHQELIALHHHDHNQYSDMDHTTLNGEHFHH